VGTSAHWFLFGVKKIWEIELLGVHKTLEWQYNFIELAFANLWTKELAAEWVSGY